MTVTMIVLPGGGYTHLAPHEGEPVAEWLRSLGIDARVFEYPVNTRYPTALDTVRAEVRRRRSEGATTVGVLGFSAGGHAAGLAALAPADAAGGTVAPDPEFDDARVDFAMLGYPVVSMLTDTHAGSRVALLGEHATTEERAVTSLERLVSASAPPFFLWHTAEDAVVPVQHSYLLATALADARVPHALHVYPRGRHGLGLAVGAGDAQHWTTAGESWLRENGWIT